MSTRSRRTDTGAITAETVAEFLAATPDFFELHPEIAARLRIPHQAGNAVSLIEKQVDILRKQNMQLERKLVDLIEVARANDAAVERIHQLVIALMEADNLPDLLHGLADRLRHRFGADAVRLILFKGEPDEVEFGPTLRLERDAPEIGEFQNVLRNGQPVVGRLRPRQLEILFEGHAARIGSAALIPIGDRAEIGMLGLGSQSEDQFGPTLGTTFLVRIGEVLATALRRYL
ncbi:MAG TPA: DUF484 family protein [Gammaproteobacteria bacterium]|nr:DUF484 family protein [Gammaproteobacteria bacterium]